VRVGTDELRMADGRGTVNGDWNTCFDLAQTDTLHSPAPAGRRSQLAKPYGRWSTYQLCF